MSNQAIKTAEGFQFHSSGWVEKRQSLFTVTPGVDIADALQSASDLLSTIEDSIYAAAMGERPLEGNAAWLVKHSLESAKAVVDSLMDAMQPQAGEQPAKE
ncbi:DUF3077 domain-containing protein [Pseudomonas stutzeri]|uniref:DUF3077 domain-containing protein n=1 Tax=Stutzerimonas stutzeri TaxID=316 RepID=UPI000C9A2352|nr:DUF3077 domain-containing protein [Stutzerimonas stutzeri]MCQ4280469.1 DUF3077 domain-containing protein [Stutzerimonas stutzeri]PNF71510.1 hypothetical protein CXK96_16870 [Stutzerimonas stutzeri]